MPKDGNIAQKIAAEMLKKKGLKLRGRMLVRLMFLVVKVKWYFLTLRSDTFLYSP